MVALSVLHPAGKELEATPPLEHENQRYVYVRFVGRPTQFPIEPTRRSETIGIPETSGTLTLAGICVGSAGTAAEVAENTVVLPALVVAVNATRRRLPTSAAVTS